MANGDRDEGDLDPDKYGRDVWQVIKTVLDENPSLKQRVMHKLRELRQRIREKERGHIPRQKKDTRMF